MRAYGFWWLLYRRTWKGSLLSTFIYPTLYLASIGLGLGGLVTHHIGVHAGSLDGVSYLQFVAPGILGASAMQVGINEASWPVMSAMRWQRTYFAQVATPIRAIDVFTGHLAWITSKLFAMCSIFLAISAAFGAIIEPSAALEVVAATLIGLAFAVPMAALAVHLESDAAFSTINRLVIVPLFLFSGTFFPISQLPRPIRTLASFTPLFQGVALCRSLALGRLATLANLSHVAYLGAMVAVGLLWARRNYHSRLWR